MLGSIQEKKITMFHTRLFKFVSGYVFILLIINNVLGDFLFQFLLTNGVKASFLTARNHYEYMFTNRLLKDQHIHTKVQ